MTRIEQIQQAAGLYEEMVGFTGITPHFIEGAKWADEHPKNPWVSVEERLPDKLFKESEWNNMSEEVICREKGINRVSAFYDYTNNRWLNSHTLLPIGFTPTHWMPIPEGGEQ